MPTTIDQGFDKLRENLRITDLQESTVAERQRNVRSALEAEMKVLDSFLVGSYKRSTMIAPLHQADVDVFIVLDTSYYQADGQASLLDRVKRVLKKTYATSELSRNGQAVTIAFSDFRVDVVPGFNRSSGGYFIPDSVLAQWIATDPKKHIQIWTIANKAHNSDLVRLIKMIKGWNRQHSEILRSFHLESLVLQVLTDVEITSFPLGVAYVFQQAKTQVRAAVLDPAGYGGDIGTYLNTPTKIEAVVSRLESADARAIEALRLESENKIPQAFERWRLVFGDYFPAYG